MNMVYSHINEWMMNLFSKYDKSKENVIDQAIKSIYYLYYNIRKSNVYKCSCFKDKIDYASLKNKTNIFYRKDKKTFNININAIIKEIEVFFYDINKIKNVNNILILKKYYKLKRKINSFSFLNDNRFAYTNYLEFHSFNCKQIILLDFVFKYLLDKKSELEIFLNAIFQKKNILPIIENIIFLYKHVGAFFISERKCLYSEKVKFILDENYNFHGDGKASIIFPDGSKEYFFHGVKLQEKYGSIISNNWKTDWVFKEKNITVKRTLIDGIGWDRLISKVNGELIDKWKEYELYRIKGVDIEIVKLLKMKCHSTESFYCLRVPPRLRKCYTALRWICHGVDKHEFVKET